MTNLNILRPSVGFRLNAYRRQPVNEGKRVYIKIWNLHNK
jgi:hypothetical protein